MPSAHGQQQRAQHQRGGGLKTLVAVGVVFVGVFLAVVVGKQHHKVGHQVGQGVDAVGNQGL